MDARTTFGLSIMRRRYRNGRHAGTEWAARPCNRLVVSRLRCWFARCNASELWDYRCVYAAMRVGIFEVMISEEPRDKLKAAAQEAKADADAFWSRIPGWPADLGGRYLFVKGFVLAAIGMV